MKRTTLKAVKLDQHGFGLLGTIVNIIFGVILTLVALRLVFTLFGANSLNGFVSWLYAASQPLVAPFAGIFQDMTILGSQVEMQTVVALIVYGLAAAILGRLFAGSGYHSRAV